MYSSRGLWKWSNKPEYYMKYVPATYYGDMNNCRMCVADIIDCENQVSTISRIEKTPAVRWSE